MSLRRFRPNRHKEYARRYLEEYPERRGEITPAQLAAFSGCTLEDAEQLLGKQ